MKNFYAIAIGLLLSTSLFAQVEGITYQAVLIDNNPDEIPGIDVPSNRIPEQRISVRFSILDAAGSLEYQEIQQTQTDPYGTISLTIGLGEQTPGSLVPFGQINWDGPKSLRVDIDLQAGSNFMEFSNQPLTYVPYVRHRNLIADGVTNLNHDLYINNQSFARFSGDVLVEQDTRLQTLTAFGESNFNDRVTIEAPMATTNQSDIDAYPLRITGSAHGMAIELSETTPGRTTNFVSFWDGNGNPVGRIEGFQALTDVSQNFILEVLLADEPDIDEATEQEDNDTAPPAPAPGAFDIYLNNDYSLNLLLEYIDLLEASSTFGWNLGACIGGLAVLGDCDDAAWSFFQLITQGIQISLYVAYNERNVGVAFESGGADYAEWLKKYDENETLNFGDVVGVRAGEISARFADAEKFMVVSRNPIVSGALPKPGEEGKFRQVAFIGQVPVKVLGDVNKGDYILPSGNGDGMAIAVSPERMRLNDYRRIIGVAWQEYHGNELFSYINTAVGINSGDLTREVSRMQEVMNRMQEALAEANPAYRPTYFDVESLSSANRAETTQSKTMQQRIRERHAIGQGDVRRQLSEMQAMMEVEDGLSPHFSFSKLPFLEEVLQNPTPENLERYNAFYQKALVRLKGLLQQ